MVDHQNNVLENRAVLTEPRGEETLCPLCGEDLVFGMRDKLHDFSLGLTNVLECLAIAEKQGYVPKLPEEWWTLIIRRYSEIEKIRNELFYQEE